MADERGEITEELLSRVSFELANLYEADEMGFLLALSEGADFTHRPSLTRFFEEGPHYAQLDSRLTPRVVDFISALQKAKAARAELDKTEPDKLELPITAAFAGRLDQSQYTKNLLQDVLASRLTNPTTPSSSSIEQELALMKQELQTTVNIKLTTKLVMEKILSGKLGLG